MDKYIATIINAEPVEGTVYAIPDPRCFKDGGIEWQMRYGNHGKYRLVAASVISTFDYLLSENLSEAEAIKRFKFLRKARKEAVNE